MPISIDRYALNDALVDHLSRYEWKLGQSEEEEALFNDLVHAVGDKIDEFLNQGRENGPDPDRMEDM